MGQLNQLTMKQNQHVNTTGNVGSVKRTKQCEQYKCLNTKMEAC